MHCSKRYNPKRVAKNLKTCEHSRPEFNYSN